jgi:hypothetical protein
VGDRLKRGKDEWEVIAVEMDASGHSVVTLEQSAHGKIKPTI